MCSGHRISQLKQVMQCSRNLITGSILVDLRPGIEHSTGAGSMWMTSAGHTRSQTPQPVHFSISMCSIIIATDRTGLPPDYKWAELSKSMKRFFGAFCVVV
jgi:hypothetical protein